MMEDMLWAFTFPKNEVDEYGVRKTDTIFPYNRLSSNEQEEILFEGTFKKKTTSNCLDNQWRLFVISDTTMFNYDWTNIVEHQKYLSKVVLTQQYLDNSNWSYQIK